MSSTFGALFGTPSKSTSATYSQTPTGYASLSPQAQETYDAALQGASGLTAQNFAPAPITSQQQQAASYFGTPISAITPEQFQSGISTFSNPFEEQVLQNAIRDLNLQAQTGYGDIASIASDAGGFGSNRRGLLESELQKNLLQTVGDVSATSRAANFENAAARTLSEIGRVDALNQQNMGSLFDIGTQFQNTATAQQNAPAQLQQYLAGLSAMLAGGGQTSNANTYEVGSTPGVFGSAAAGGAAQGVSTALMAGAGGSDIRLKENIKKVSNERGFNIYEWNYKDQPDRWRGVMAQEVQETRPDAVTMVNGFLWVIYDKLGLRMEAANA